MKELSRVAAALIVFILCVFKWQDTIISIGQLFGLSGFLALYIPSTLVGLSVYRIVDLGDWGIWDAAAFLTIGSIAMLAMTMIAPATVAAMVMISVSLFLICANSCARTPFSSSSVRRFNMPSVTHTAA